MSNRGYFITVSLIATLLVALSGSRAPLEAETVKCTAITALPAVINFPGVYCFTGTLSTAMTSGNAIVIASNDVVLDLNGFTLDGSAAGTGTTATGIIAGNRRYITIKNGTVRGFLTGIALVDTGRSQANVVEDIRALQNRLTGIQVDGRGNLIRNNLVVITGGATCCGPGLPAVGISAGGVGPRVLNNDVIDTTSPGDVGSRAIDFPSTVGGLAVNNRITNADTSIHYDLGSTGKYRDNLTFDAGGVVGGTNAGNNN